MQRVPYRGHVIEAGHQELRDGLGYASKIFIERDLGWATDVTEFHLPRTFDTAELATATAIEAGRHAIDLGYTDRVVTVKS